jgi:hypothetical protein
MLFRIITLTGREYEAPTLEQAQQIHETLLSSGETAFLIVPQTAKSA